MKACQIGFVDIVKLLLEQKEINVNAQNVLTLY